MDHGLSLLVSSWGGGGGGGGGEGGREGGGEVYNSILQCLVTATMPTDCMFNEQ